MSYSKPTFAAHTILAYNEDPGAGLMTCVLVRMLLRLRTRRGGEKRWSASSSASRLSDIDDDVHQLQSSLLCNDITSAFLPGQQAMCFAKRNGILGDGNALKPVPRV